MRIPVHNGHDVAKRMVYLAYKAARTLPIADERVLKADAGIDDMGFPPDESGGLHLAYVHGRIVKLTIEWDRDSVTVPDHEPQVREQSWCVEYPSYGALGEAAIAMEAEDGLVAAFDSLASKVVFCGGDVGGQTVSVDGEQVNIEDVASKAWRPPAVMPKPYTWRENGGAM